MCSSPQVHEGFPRSPRVAICYGVAAIYLALLGVSEYLAYARVATTTAYLLGAAVMAAAALIYLAAMFLHPRQLSKGLAAGTFVMISVAVVASVWFYRPRGWDAASYLNGSLAILGYETTFPIHRAPLTSIVNAPFAFVPWLTNPILLALSCWTAFALVRRTGSTALACAASLAIMSNNLILSSLFTTNSELPAVALMLLAVLLLQRDHLFSAGVVFGLASLARWNLAVFPVAVTIAIAWRRGGKTGIRLASGGVLVFLAFVLAYYSLFDSPLRSIMDDNLMPGSAWAADEDRPTTQTRFLWYTQNFYFLTPLGFSAAWLCLFGRRYLANALNQNCDWEFALSWGVIAFCGAMTFIGWHLPRLITPAAAVAIVLIFRLAVLLRTSDALLTESMQRIWHHSAMAAITVTIIAGIWPASFLFEIRDNLKWSNMEPDLCREVVALGIREQINLPNISPFCDSGGREASYHLRTSIRIHWNRTGGARHNIPAKDWRDAQGVLLHHLQKGDLAVLHIDSDLAPESVRILARGKEWMLCRILH